MPKYGCVPYPEGSYTSCLLAAAPDLLAACLLGDSLGNTGPTLLHTAADLLGNFAPVTALELRRKAEAEMSAIHKAQRESEVSDG